MAPPHRRTSRLVAATALLLLLPLGRAAAEAADAPERPSQHGLYFELQPGYYGFETALGYRVRTTKGPQLGIELGSGFRNTVFIAGRQGEDANTFRTRLTSLTPVWEDDGLAFAVRAEAGFRRTWDAEAYGTSDGTAPVPLPSSSSWALELELGLLGYLNVHPRAVLRMGVLIPLGLEVSPTSELDMFGGVLLLGIQGRVGERWWLYGDFQAGGVGGFQGDGAKIVLGGVIGVRVAIGKEPESWEVF